LEFLEKENAKLRKRLSKYENRPKKNQSLCESTGKKLGGQLRRKGCTLEMSSVPSRIIDLIPEYCNDFGLSLKEVVAIKEKTRQIVDISPIKPELCIKKSITC